MALSNQQVIKKASDYGVHVTVEELSSLRRGASGLHLDAQRRALAAMSGSHHSAFRGRGIDFDEARVYQPGDDVRNIDWRVTARSGETHTKIFREERERPVYLVVDQGASMYFGSQACFKSVAAARAAAALAWSAYENKDRIGGLVFSQWDHLELRPKAGKRGIQCLFRGLSIFNQDIGKNIRDQKQSHARALTRTLKSLNKVVRPGSLVFIISDFQDFDDLSMQNLSMLSRYNDIIAVMVSDQMELHLPPAGSYGFSNGKKRLKINTGDRFMRNRYTSRFTQHHTRVRNQMLSAGTALIDLSTQADIYETLGKSLKQRSTLRRP